MNTCASRRPEDENVASPGSHCRSCGRKLSWWENIPVLSWLALRGRCRTCKGPIGVRYVLAELSVAILWACAVWQAFITAPELNAGIMDYAAWMAVVTAAAKIVFLWILVALAVLDAENLWLPDRLTIPGIFLGLVLATTRGSLTTFMHLHGGLSVWKHVVIPEIILFWFLGAVIPAGALLVIRQLYQMIRGQEGMGLGDVKLLAMLGGWIGMKGAGLSFVIALGIGTILSLILFFFPQTGNKNTQWAVMKLPFGTFICIGGIIAGLWGEPLLALYRAVSSAQ